MQHTYSRELFRPVSAARNSTRLQLANTYGYAGSAVLGGAAVALVVERSAWVNQLLFATADQPTWLAWLCLAAPVLFGRVLVRAPRRLHGSTLGAVLAAQGLALGLSLSVLGQMLGAGSVAPGLLVGALFFALLSIGGRAERLDLGHGLVLLLTGLAASAVATLAGGLLAGALGSGVLVGAIIPLCLAFVAMGSVGRVRQIAYSEAGTGHESLLSALALLGVRV